MRGPFDTDQTALAVREKLNARGTNINSLLFEKLTLTDTTSVLELGCGNGKQTRCLKQHFPDMPIVAVDIAASNNRGVPPGTVILTADMDKLHFSPLFDVVLSVYSFYYSQDMVALGKRVATWLKPGGKFLVMGPGQATNYELVELVNSTGKYTMPCTMDFISEEQINEINRSFETVTVSYKPNMISCRDRAEFLGWWENHNSYNPEARAMLEEKGMIPECMKLTKNVMCLVFSRD